MRALLVLAALFVFVGCNKDEKPKPPVVVEPSPTPSFPKDGAFCSASGNKFHCGTNEWWKLDCGPGDHQVYFASKDAISAKSDELKMSGCVKVTFKDGSQENVHFGFGPCLPCSEM